MRLLCYYQYIEEVPNMNIGSRIKNRRIQLELSVDDVAEQLGKNRATVYRYENNDIENLPTTVLEPLAKILKTTPAYLMGWTDEQILNDKPDSYHDIINFVKKFIPENNDERKKTLHIVRRNIHLVISEDRNIYNEIQKGQNFHQDVWSECEKGNYVPLIENILFLSMHSDISIEDFFSATKIQKKYISEKQIKYYCMNPAPSVNDNEILEDISRDISVDYSVDLTDDMQILLEVFKKANSDSRYLELFKVIAKTESSDIEKITDMIEVLQKHSSATLPNAAHNRTDIPITNADIIHDEDIMDDDNF